MTSFTDPQRAHVFVSTVSADTVERLAAELRWLADQIEMGKITTGVSGGPTSGSIYSYKVSPEETHDAYFAAVARWLVARRNQQSN